MTAKREHIQIGLVFLSNDLRVIGVNDIARRLFGSKNALMGVSLLHYHPEKSRGKVRDVLKELTLPRGDMSGTMILDILGRVLLTNMSRLTFLRGSNAPAWAVTFMDVTRQTVAAKNPLSGMLQLKKLPLYENGTFSFIAAEQIHLIEADGNYCRIYTAQKKHYVLMSLKAVLDRFVDADLVRVHKSYVVNLKHVRTIERSDGNRTIVTFDNPAIPSVPASRRCASVLRKAIAAL